MPSFNQTFLERGQDMVTLFNEQDANTDITGDWVKVRDYERVAVFLCKFGTEDVDDIGLQLLQGTDATGAGSKALTAIDRTWYKTGTLTSQTVWTAGTAITTTTDFVAFGSAVPTGATRVIADVNTDALILQVDFETTKLDADGGFDWFTVFIEGDNVNNAVLLTCFVVLMGCRYPQAIPLTSIA